MWQIRDNFLAFLVAFPILCFMRRIGFFLASFLVCMLPGAWAAEIPFTDVKPTDSYYNAVRELYQNHIISDDGSHLFRPKDLMARDFYVALAVTIGCKECETPSYEDIIKYRVSPFVDLSKINQYYYCIAYAKEAWITQGYTPDNTGRAYCDDKTSYTSSPFCTSNNISRIEAAAVLLRRANLWNDTLNASNFERNITIPDTSNYWYGYAKKAIEAGIIKQKKDGTIGQDEKITRWEFALMSSKILAYTQCELRNVDNKMEWAIGIRGTGWLLTSRSSFKKDECPVLVPITASGSWNYSWNATNLITGKTLSGTDASLPTCPWFDTWPWIVYLDIIDPARDVAVSSPSTTITISENTNDHIGVLLEATPLVSNIGGKILFKPAVSNPANHQLQYAWDFGDGGRGSTKGNTEHAYGSPGIFTVTLTVTDTETWEVAQASIIVRITGDTDTDGDGIFDDEDRCILVFGEKNNFGCPRIETWDPTPIQNYISSNICLKKYQEDVGLLIGQATCEQCPCKNSINIVSLLRSCDVVFPTILSPDMTKVYARWGFSIVP